jgi:tyrosyl-tRNA synthetase
MGKSENGAIWLDEKFLSAYDYWQFWRNTDDRDVIKFLKNFTDLEIEDIKKIENNNINDLKILLANKQHLCFMVKMLQKFRTSC